MIASHRRRRAFDKVHFETFWMNVSLASLSLTATIHAENDGLDTIASSKYSPLCVLLLYVFFLYFSVCVFYFFNIRLVLLLSRTLFPTIFCFFFFAYTQTSIHTVLYIRWCGKSVCVTNSSRSNNETNKKKKTTKKVKANQATTNVKWREKKQMRTGEKKFGMQSSFDSFMFGNNIQTFIFRDTTWYFKEMKWIKKIYFNFYFTHYYNIRTIVLCTFSILYTNCIYGPSLLTKIHMRIHTFTHE